MVFKPNLAMLPLPQLRLWDENERTP